MAGELVWYAAYGSNMRRERFDRYRVGFRDGREPLGVVALELAGALYFATESPVWGGGRAFYDPDAAGWRTPARGYLLRPGQFADLVAQEMYREPGAEVDVAAVVAAGRLRLGPGRYETLVCVGERDGRPVLTCTAPWRYRDVVCRPPSAEYLRQLGAGLIAGHGWDAERAGRYLASRPGAAAGWTAAQVAALLA